MPDWLPRTCTDTPARGLSPSVESTRPETGISWAFTRNDNGKRRINNQSLLINPELHRCIQQSFGKKVKQLAVQQVRLTDRLRKKDIILTVQYPGVPICFQIVPIFGRA
jgi:hypothetical protein